jgi:two-component system, chemotaxis family, chemotaxis protein CheY
MLPDGYAQLKLMFVDDALATRILLREMLGHGGFQEVTIVDGALVAFELIKRNPPDLVFTDWQMPERSGLDLLRDIRTSPDSPDPLLPVIMLTVKDGEDYVIRGRNAGATAYLIKPITLRGIIDRITDAVMSPRAFVVAPHYVGPDRRQGQTRTGNERRGEQTPAFEHIIIPPDRLLAAKVRRDFVAFDRALQARTEAIALIRRTLHAAESV